MSTGQWIGAILGAIVGFILGNWVGLIYGAIIGFSLGSIVDPVKPDVKQPGAPAPQGLQIMTNVIGNPIFDVLGTAKITGQLLFFGKEFNRPIWYRPARGVRAISGYKYHASWALGICMGPVDCLYTVFRDQDPIWEGELTRPESGGEATIQIEGGGTMVFYFGTDDQVPNINAGTLIPDPTLNTGYRHLCWAFFDAFFMNEYNRMPSMSFIVRKTPPLFSEVTSQIQTYDINPAHALWHTLIEKAGLPVEWVDPVDFLAVATELFAEDRGISILFDTYQATQNYLEAINSHVDCILRYGSDGKFHPKLIRYVSPVDLPIIDESKLLEEPTFSRRSWIDTINEVKVQYSEILGERIIEVFRKSYLGFVPLHLEVEGDYIYVCGQQAYTVSDVDYCDAAVMKVNKTTLEVVNQFNLRQATNNVSNAFYRVHIDGDDIYLTGRAYQNSSNRAIVTKRNKNTLSTGYWTIYPWTGYIPAATAVGTGLVTDTSYLYVVGIYNDTVNHDAAARFKLNKSDGSTVWYSTAVYSDYDMVIDIGGSILISGSGGGSRFLNKINKTTNVSTLYTIRAFDPTVPNYYMNSGLLSSGGKYYVCGNSWTATYGTQRVSVFQCDDTLVNLIVPDWEWTKNYTIPHLVESLLNCVTDGSSLYSIGYIQQGPLPFYYNQAIIAKIDLDGAYLWDLEHETLHMAAHKAIGLLDADTLIVGVYDSNVPTPISLRYGYLEKRSILTGLIATR